MVTMTQYARLTTGTHGDPNQPPVDITVIESDLDSGGGTVAWADVTGKPSSFTPATHTHTAAQVSDATATGRSVVTAADAAAARTAIGAGTSSIIVGTAAANAAAGNHSHTATQVTATAISPGTGTNVQAILAELAARITALEAV